MEDICYRDISQDGTYFQQRKRHLHRSYESINVYALPSVSEQDVPSEYDQLQIQQTNEVNYHRPKFETMDMGNHGHNRKDYNKLRKELKRVKLCLSILSLIVVVVIVTSLIAFVMAVICFQSMMNIRSTLSNNQNVSALDRQLDQITTEIYENASMIVHNGLRSMNNVISNLQDKVLKQPGKY